MVEIVIIKASRIEIMETRVEIVTGTVITITEDVMDKKEIDILEENRMMIKAEVDFLAFLVASIIKMVASLVILMKY